VSDVNGKNGGNIIYITSAGGYRKESVPSAVLAIVNALEGYSIESLSQVIKDDKTMAL
jgi:acetoin utilization deacetylase AcuC-like enzyme